MNCAFCETPFTPRLRTQKYCSRQCSRRASDARRKGGTSVYPTFELCPSCREQKPYRAFWVCRICWQKLPDDIKVRLYRHRFEPEAFEQAKKEALDLLRVERTPAPTRQSLFAGRGKSRVAA